MGLCRGNTLRGSAAPHAAEVKAGLAKANMVRVIPVCKLIPQPQAGHRGSALQGWWAGPGKTVWSAEFAPYTLFYRGVQEECGALAAEGSLGSARPEWRNAPRSG